MVQLSFDIERLEHRQMLAGNVTAQIVNGELRIAGDELDNLVVVTDSFETEGPNELVVFGLEGTLINGQQSAVFQSSQLDDLRVDLAAGNDGLAFNVDQSWIARDVLIRMGSGDDLVEFGTPRVEGRTRILTGDGVDRVDVDGTSFGELQIQTGAGGDEIHLNGLQVTGTSQIQTGRASDLVTVNGGSEFVGDVEFNLGAGDVANEGDYLRFHGDATRYNLFGSNLLLRGSGGPQTVIAGFVNPIDFQANGNSINVNLGAGEDRLDFDRAHFEGSANIRMGQGEDFVRFETTYFGADLLINTGRDADTTLLDDVSMRNGTIITAGGHDVLHSENGLTMSELRVRTGSGDDLIQLGSEEFGPAQVQGRLDINSGSGRDALQVLAVTDAVIDVTLGSGDDSAEILAQLYGQFDVDFGGGNDVLDLTVAWNGVLSFDGGAGQDEMVVNDLEPETPNSTVEFISFEMDTA